MCKTDTLSHRDRNRIILGGKCFPLEIGGKRGHIFGLGGIYVCVWFF